MIYSESERIASSMEKRKKISKVITAVVTCILIFMVLFSLLLISLELGNSKELPSFLNMNLYIVTSTSMKPRLNVDDVIIVKSGYTNNEYKVGNIITFKKQDGEIVTHRIKKIVLSDLRNAYITQGDNNEAEDEQKVEYEQILGKVIYTMPKFVKLLKNKIFFTLALTSLIAFLIYDKRVMKRKEDRRRIRKEHERETESGF